MAYTKQGIQEYSYIQRLYEIDFTVYGLFPIISIILLQKFIAKKMFTQAAKVKLSPQVISILKELKPYLKNLYQEELAKIILYGSQARGDAQPDSDIDVLIVLKSDFSFYQESKRINNFVTDLCLKYEVLLSCSFSTLTQLKSQPTAFYRNVTNEGIEVMDLEQQKLLEKGAKSLAAARKLNQENFPEFSASRAYYCMFYIAEAFLLKEGLSFSKHSAVIGAFGREFASKKRIPVEYHRHLIEAERIRLQGDYNTDTEITRDDANTVINQAEIMLNFAQNNLDLI
ncbi:MAG: HEPN domain-containing protein [Spirulinaceae cyanobacterium]